MTQRLMAFYDGGYFRAGQVFFRYKERKGWFSLPELHKTFEKYVASKAKSPTEVTKLVAAHYYDGRMTTNVAEASQLEKDRDFEMALIKAGIIPHFLPLSERPKGSPGADGEVAYQLAQKGVDVELALDVLDYAHTDRYDTAVIVAGDGDFVPLVRRVTSLGKSVLIAHFSFEAWEDDRQKPHKPCYVSADLVSAATWTLDFNHFVRDKDWSTEVKSLFFRPKNP